MESKASNVAATLSVTVAKNALCSTLVLIPAVINLSILDTKSCWVKDVATNDNAYLEEQEDGSYLFYYSGTAIPIPKEEVDAGMYDLYPIKPYSDNSGLFSTILEWLQTLKWFN